MVLSLYIFMKSQLCNWIHLLLNCFKFVYPIKSIVIAYHCKRSIVNKDASNSITEVILLKYMDDFTTKIFQWSRRKSSGIIGKFSLPMITKESWSRHRHEHSASESRPNCVRVIYGRYILIKMAEENYQRCVLC